MSIEQESYVTAEEIAQALKVKTSTFYGWVRRKELSCVKIGPRLVRFRQSDLKRLTRDSEQPPPEAA
jgi:excisionase family DNA binding protein